MAVSTTSPHSDQALRMMLYAALMSAFIAVGAFIIIPIGPVPIVLQNLFVLLAGLLLGSRWASTGVGIYLLAGICGLPVFAGGRLNQIPRDSNTSLPVDVTPELRARGAIPCARVEEMLIVLAADLGEGRET